MYISGRRNTSVKKQTYEKSVSLEATAGFIYFERIKGWRQQVRLEM